ncbi:MAG: TetR/AcrR family transcriptional regulator [Fimbriiglobus sp.]
MPRSATKPSKPSLPKSGKAGRPKNPELEQRRKTEILAVAAEVFAKTGYAETDVQVIADQLNLGKGTIYRYFPTKQELFLATVNQGLAELVQEVDSVILDETRAPLDRFADVVRGYLAFFARRPEMVELFIQERATFRDHHQPRYFAMQDAELCKPEDDFLTQLLDAGVLRPLGLEQIKGVISDLLYGTIMANSFSGRPASPIKQANDILDILFHGILSESKPKTQKRNSSKKLGKTKS